MTSTELTIVGLLLLVASQTSYTTYRTWRGAAARRSQPVFIDTSVLMDGRIIPIAETGFIPGNLVIPRSVVGELQFLADHGDSDKREKARRGLDVVNELQALEHLQVEILQDGSKAEEGVDERLLFLAKKHSGILCTIDFNLNKVAQVENIRVLNVNQLAQQLRMSYLPGDKLSLGLTTPGSDSHQAVGHLPDGTMVVVEHAKTSIGKTVEVEIIRSLQTAAGRMMFAKLVDSKPAGDNAARPPRKQLAAKGRKPEVQKQATNKPEAKPATEISRKPASRSRVDDKPASKPAPQRRRSSASKSGRRPSSAEREASLVDLIDQQ